MKNIEECWILKGSAGSLWWNGKYDRYTTGLPATVAFDYNYVLKEEQSIVGWLHTHPHWPAIPSATDNATMNAWTSCLGRSLLCCIQGTDKLRAYIYKKDIEVPTEVKVWRVHNRIFCRNG